MSNTATVTQATTTTTAPAAKVEFGEGRYSAVMREAYTDALRLVTDDSAKAEKFARQLGADLGRAMAASPVKVGYGKANKDGRMSLKEAATVKGVVSTQPLALARLITAANDINASKLARVDGLTLAGTLAEWFNSL